MIVILWIAFSLVVGLLAKTNGRSFFMWFALSLIVDPILGFILYNVVAKNK